MTQIKTAAPTGIKATAETRLPADYNAATAFLAMLAPDGDVTFQTFDDNADRKASVLVQVIHATPDTIATAMDRLAALDRQGAGVFVTVNKTNGSGRRAANITAVRALFADFDTVDDDRPALLQELCTLPPSILVESSAAKHHAYWLVDDLPLDRFTEAQKAIIGLLGSDAAVHDLPRVMRLPGFTHHKVKDGVASPPITTRIIGGTGTRYTLAEITEWLASIQPVVTPRSSLAGVAVPIDRYAESALERAVGAVMCIADGGRNDALNREAHGLYGLVLAGRLPMDKVTDRLIQAAKVCGLSDGEIRTTLDSAYNAASPRYDGMPRDRQPVVARAPNDSGAPARPLPELPPVASFDLRMLPDSFRPFIEDVQERIQCPVDFLAVGAMTALSAAVGRRRRIYGKLHDDWAVTPNLWGMFIGRPSAMKSPALASVAEPLQRIERELGKAHEERAATAKAEQKVQSLKVKSAEDTAKKRLTAGDDTADIVELLAAVEMSEPLPVLREQVVVNDATVEALQVVMAGSPKGVIMLRDELSGWLKKLEAEDQAESRSFILTSYNGNQPFIVNRIMRGITEVPYCCLSVLGCIQPSKIANVTKAAISGSSDDGLIQRFQMAVWPDDAGHWKNIDRQPDYQASRVYGEVFEHLHALDVDEEPLRMTPEAMAAFTQWRIDFTNQARTGGHHPAIESHMLKAPDAILSLMLLLELADKPNAQAIGITAATKALAWAEYLHSHALRLYHNGAQAEIEAARVILKKRANLPDGFTVRAVTQKGWAGCTDGRTVEEALLVLQDHGWLTQFTPINPAGGRPTTHHHWRAGN